MPGRGQYPAKHGLSGIEVVVTYPRPLEEIEQRALKAITDAFVRGLGELEKADIGERCDITRLVAHIIGHTNDFLRCHRENMGMILVIPPKGIGPIGLSFKPTNGHNGH